MKDLGEKGAVLVSALLLIVGLAAGFGAAKAMDNNDKKDTATHSDMDAKTSDKASDLRADLVAIGTEHQDLTAMAVDQALDGAPGADAAKADLIKNGETLSAAVGSVYGADAQKKFNDIWNVHLLGFVDYAVASKSGDEAAKTAALSKIDAEYTKPISALLSGANPNLPNDALLSGFGEHIGMTAKMIDFHTAGNYTEEAKMRADAVTHLKGLMTTLAGAIVKQFPDKF